MEVDGYVHVQKRVAEKDRLKQECLQSAGYTVLRFTNDECFYDLKRCLAQVKDAVAKARKKPPILHGSLSPWQVSLQDYRKQAFGF